MSRKRSKRLWIIVALVVVVVVAGVVARQKGWLGGNPMEQVITERASERTIVELITANGRVQPEVEVKIAPEVSGEIVELNIKEGDRVQKGQLLIRIKPDTYVSMKERSEASLSSSEAQLLQIEAQLLLAEQTYNRQKGLFEQKAIAESEFQTAQGQYNQLRAQKKAQQANIAASRAQLKQSEEDLFKTTIYAPASGTVSKLSVELGERVVGTATMAGTEMLRLADLSNMEVRADVNENDIVRVSLGDSAAIEVDAYLGRKFKGVVTRIANSAQGADTPSSDQVTNYEVRIQIQPSSYADLVSPNSPSPFRPGMSSTTDIFTNTARALSVPIQAVTSRMANGSKEQVVFVYLPDSSIVRQVKVETGIQDKNFIEIKESAIDSTMLIVTGPFAALSKRLTSGMKVELKIDKNINTKK
ncbi:MAG: efflux RND transporter periplasmic adaptor subunit [Mucinivorans sp.]